MHRGWTVWNGMSLKPEWFPATSRFGLVERLLIVGDTRLINSRGIEATRKLAFVIQGARGSDRAA